MVRAATLPLVNLVGQYRSLRRVVLRAVDDVLSSGAYINGPQLQAFEQELARWCGTAHGVGVASGTDALELALRAAGVGPGDEVITTPLTFIATVEAILEVGARPVLADVEPDTLTLDMAAAARRITRRTKAIIPVHLYGQPADMDGCLRLARRHYLTIIEDCAQAIGATFGGRPVGSIGDAGCLSFYPAKNLGAYGDGGAVVTRRGGWAGRIRLLRDHGARRKYQHVMLGMNSRLDELHAAILRIKLRRLRRWTAQRRQVATWYTAAFRRAGVAPSVLPYEAPGRRHVYHLYVVRTRQRARLQAACAAAGVATGMHYPIPLHLQPALRALGYHRGSLPQSERAARETLSLPLFPEMTLADVQRAVRAAAPVLREEPSRR